MARLRTQYSTVTSSAGGVVASGTAPTGPHVGLRWYNTTTGVTYQYTSDGASSFWLDISSGGIGTSAERGVDFVGDTDPHKSTSTTGAGLAVGSVYFNREKNRHFVCTDTSTDANVWSGRFDAQGGVEADYVVSSTKYRSHTFLGNGILYVHNAVTVDYLVVAGGGQGGCYDSSLGYGSGVNGQDSSLIGTGVSLVAVGGGGGGAWSSRTLGLAGGSGGGASGQTTSGNGGGAPTAGQGNYGGYGFNGGGNNLRGGGGGGAGGAGVNGASNNHGNGGAGIANFYRDGNASGTTAGWHHFAGGGGGGGWAYSGTGGTTTHGGGAGGASTPGAAGTANSGGGGGAGDTGQGAGHGGGGAGGAKTATGQALAKGEYKITIGVGGKSPNARYGGLGGSGIVVVRYPLT